MHSYASPKPGSGHNVSPCSSPGCPPRFGWPCGEQLLRQLGPMLRRLSARLAGADLQLREDFFQVGAAAALTALERFDARKGLVEHFAARSARGSVLNYRRSLWRRQREICVGTFAEADTDTAESGVALSLQLDALEATAEAPAFDAMDCGLMRGLL